MSAFIGILENLKVEEFDAGAVFSGSASGKMVKGFAEASPFVPAVDEDYIFHEHSRDMVVWFLDNSDPLYVFGPTGCGKTSCIKQLAARLNYPVFEVTGHGRLEFPEMAGHLSVRGGSMEFEYGPLALAMKYGGLFLLNEIDLLEPSTAAGLNGILDGQPLCIPENGGELVVPHPMFRFAATANSNGGSDETGLYQGVLRQNIALMDRFWLCEVGYPSPEAEEGLLAKAASRLPHSLRRKMVEYANEIRQLFMGAQDSFAGNSLEVTFSTRSLLRWAELTVRYRALAAQGVSPVNYALDRALGFRAGQESRAMLHELAQRMFPHKQSEPAARNKAARPEEAVAFSIDYFSPEMIAQSLEVMAACIVQDPDFVSSLPDLPRVTLAKDTASGGKFWLGLITPDGVSLRWGKAGTAGTAKFIPCGECRRSNPALELKDRALDKLGKGYRLVPHNTKLS